MVRALVDAVCGAVAVGLLLTPVAAEPSWPTPDAVRRSLRERVVSCEGGKSVRHRVEFGVSAKRLAWPNSEQVIAVETRGEAPCRPGRHEAIVKVRTESGVKVVRIGYRVIRDEWRPVLAKDLPRGHRIAKADLTWQWVDMGRNTDGAPSLDDPLVLRRRGREGEALTSRLVETPLEVTRGDRVSVVAHRTGIVVRTEGIAQGSGRVGDRIRVKNLTSGETFEAEIVGTREVEL